MKQRYTLSVKGWMDDLGNEWTANAVIRHLLIRISNLEEHVRLHTHTEQVGAFLCPCGEWIRDDMGLAHRGTRRCLPCLDGLVVDDPEGIKPRTLAWWALRHGVHIPSHEQHHHWTHYCDHLDCGVKGDEDYVNMKELLTEIAP